jgi:nucleoside-diphosphate-sugar epimerase
MIHAPCFIHRSNVTIEAANSDHTPSVKSIIMGLSKGKKGGHYIHLSGAAGVVEFTDPPGDHPTSKIWDDVSDVREITTFDHAHVHADTEQTVVRLGVDANVPTAVILPATIYGEGEGPIKRTSMQIPWLVDAAKKMAQVFVVGDGRSIWSGVHVKDLADGLMVLLEEAVSKNEEGKASWGKEGFYYVEGQEFSWGELSRELGTVMFEKGLVKTPETKKIGADEAGQLHPYGPLLWGSNCRIRGTRLRGLGWSPRQPTVMESVRDFV